MNMNKIVDARILKAEAQRRKNYRGKLARTNTAGPVMLIQGEGLNGEPLQAVEYFQHFGFASHAPKGAMLVCVPMGGKSAHSIVVASEHGSYKLKGQKEGESALYDSIGQQVYLTKSGIIVKGAGLPITITDTPKVRMETDMLEVTGEIKDLCDSPLGRLMSWMRNLYNQHTHSDPQGGSVAPPNQQM